MSDILPFLIAGIVTGSVYGLAGVGLVLTYKTSGIFNFAYGSLATVAAFIFYELHTQHNMPWPIAAVIALIVAGPVFGIVLERFGRVLSDASAAVQVLGTIGLLLIVEYVVLLIYGTTQTRVVAQFLPQGGFTVDSAPVTGETMITFALGLLGTAGLYVYFRATRAGIAMRAVVDNPDLLNLTGTNPSSVRRGAWMIGSTFAALCGILIAPLLPEIDGTTLTLLVVTAFGAAAIGLFSSLPMTYLGGLIIGVGSSLSTKYFTGGFLTALPSGLPFLVLFIVLIAAPTGKLRDSATRITSRSSTWRFPAQIQIGGGVVVAAVLLLAPEFAGIHLSDWTTFAANITLFLSLGLLVRTSGQVSLCHVTLSAIGVVAIAHLTAHHVPWFAAIFIAGLIAVPIGAILAVPAVRLSGLFLALATLGFGIIVEYMFYGEGYMFGTSGVGVNVPRPEVFQSDKGYYYLVLAFAAAATLFVAVVNRSRLGRLLRALADSPTGLSASGTEVNLTRVIVFSLSAFLAAIGGALGGGVVGIVTSSNYSPLVSLSIFAIILLSVGGTPWYAILGAGLFSLVPSYVTNSNATNWLNVIFGVGAVLYVLTPDSRRGVPHRVRAIMDGQFRSEPGRLGRLQNVAGQRLKVAPSDSPPAIESVPGVAASVSGSGSRGLEVRDLQVRFGGVVAVRSISLEAPIGRITGLIGPNGAGKTTTFNACSGLNRPGHGTISLDGGLMSGRGPSRRARLGLGRTFQQIELFDNLTVWENISIGREGGFAGLNPFMHIAATRRQTSAASSAAYQAMLMCDLHDVSDSLAGALSTGQRRLVELARCLAGSFKFLLLDEPSSGLDQNETRRLGEILQRIVEQREVGILLVEHDMTLVTDICHQIFVMDFGEMIFTGSPVEVMNSPAVRSAYLGSDSELGVAREIEEMR